MNAIKHFFHVFISPLLIFFEKNVYSDICVFLIGASLIFAKESSSPFSGNPVPLSEGLLSDDHWLQGWKNSYTTQGDEEARRQTD
jgi:hypothetical protein